MTDAKKPVYRRILLKMSGQALMGDSSIAVSPDVLTRMSEEIKAVHDRGVQVALVVGGGNFFRGEALSKLGIDRITGDHMGMLATLMNALVLRDSFESAGLQVRIMSSIPVSGMVGHFNQRKAINHLQEGRVLIFGAGTGNPLVTTDTAASLRGIEIGADIILKATNVDGIYDKDPSKHADAIRYRQVDYQEVLKKELGVMDLAAFCQCRDHQMPIRVFNMHKPGALLRVIMGEDEGTLVSKEKNND